MAVRQETRMAAKEVPSQLLQLPDPCLLAVLQCCADEPSSLFSAARAHSRLHQAAVLALSCITVDRVWQQEAVDRLLIYLARHGQHVDSIDHMGNQHYEISLRQLPDHLNLSSLKLGHLSLQLQPGGGFQGVVRPGLTLKQLRLHDCKLLDGAKGLAAALALLPGLQHLSISNTKWTFSWGFKFSTGALSALQQLTHLELVGAEVYGPDPKGPALQPLQALTRLADLRLSLAGGPALINNSMFVGAQHLTRLYLLGRAVLAPGALAPITQLQYLDVALYDSGGRAVGVAQILSELQHLQQLTYLQCSCDVSHEGNPPPAAAFSALTASSKLQHLNISSCMLPAGVWQHIFPAGRQLPHLQVLNISDVKQPGTCPVPAPEGSRLVSCCPALQQLDMERLQYSAGRLASLAGLSGLHTLRVAGDSLVEGVEAVCQLTGLRELHLHSPLSSEGVLLQLAQLKRLTQLNFSRTEQVLYWGMRIVSSFKSEAPGDEPVWRQIMQGHLDHSDPIVAQQAAAALAGE